MPVPPILVIAPPPVLEPKGPLAHKFANAAGKSAGFSNAYRDVAAELGCHFFDAATVARTSEVDGIHLDADQHVVLGKALARFVAALPDVFPSTTP